MTKLQTILGSGGAIGTLLAKELPNYTEQIRLVSRNPNTGWFPNGWLGSWGCLSRS